MRMKMMSKTFIGIDNGVSGSIGLIYPNGTSAFLETPVIKVESYTKKAQYIHRIDWVQLIEHIPKDSFVLMERPMINPHGFNATLSAARALEATIIVLEMLYIEYKYIDSKEWQQEFIASGLIGKKDMKKASLEIGIELFPNHTTKINKHGDADGILIAEYARRKYSDK
jgi:hypothetical protein